MTDNTLALRRGDRFRVTRPGARMTGMKSIAAWTQQGCSVDLAPGDELEYLGMLYSGGSDGIDTHQFRIAGTHAHPDACHVRDFRPRHPEARSMFDTRPDPSFLERIEP